MKSLPLGSVVLASALGLFALQMSGCSGDKGENETAPEQKAEETTSGYGYGEQAVDNTMAAAESAGDAISQKATEMGEAVGSAMEQAGDKAEEVLAAVTPGATEVNGESIYKTSCFTCHDAGVANAPKLGDKAAWEPRIATGRDALISSALNGKGAMPAKGGNTALSDEQVIAVIDYMIEKAK